MICCVHALQLSLELENQKFFGYLVSLDHSLNETDFWFLGILLEILGVMGMLSTSKSMMLVTADDEDDSDEARVVDDEGGWLTNRILSV